jgi:hypoxanthine phosphoribosyltransferase
LEKVESFRCKLVSWDEISKWTAQLAKNIRAQGFHPSVIIGLTRGGWVPARLLCDHLKVKKLYAVKTEHWGVTANPDGKALLTQELNTSIEQDNVLAVDDITDTGESLTLAMAHLSIMHPRQLHSATLLHITHSKFQPDFFSVEVPKEKWTWFIFPWNLNEDLRTLTPKTMRAPVDIDGIRAAFKKQFRIGPSTEMVKSALAELEAECKVQRRGGKWEKANS